MRKTKEIMIGNKKIGGNNKILIQSMTTTLPRNIDETITQINRLIAAGADIVRFTVMNEDDALAIREIKSRTSIPLVADIHFDYRLALKSIENGIDKIRINPGNIGNDEYVRLVVEKCKEKHIPIRIGVNSGSIEKEILKKNNGNLLKSAIKSVKYHVSLLEKFNFFDIVISIKMSNVLDTIEAYQEISNLYDYPLHIGLTESGTINSGTIKSSVALGILLYKGIGDTIRVSLTGDPVREIIAAKELLSSLDLYDKPNLICCPTCGRTTVELEEIALEIEKYLSQITKKIAVAIMGCVVNGPGEAKTADLGVAFGEKGKCVLFRYGEVYKTIDAKDAVSILKTEIDFIIKNKN